MRIALFLLASMLVSACAVSTPATITSAQSSPNPITSIQLLGASGDAGQIGNLRARFHGELTEHIRARGIAIGTEADFVADFAVSQRDAAVGLQPVLGTDDTAEPIEPSLRGRWYHKCKPTRVSASMVVYARISGAVQAKSSGEFLACPDDLSQLDELAKVLVGRIISN